MVEPAVAVRKRTPERDLGVGCLMGAVLGLLVGVAGSFTFLQIVFAAGSLSSGSVLGSLLLVVLATTLLGAIIGVLWSRR
jgi:hypothetical protein